MASEPSSTHITYIGHSSRHTQTNMLAGESEVPPEMKGKLTGEPNPSSVGWARQDLFFGARAL